MASFNGHKNWNHWNVSLWINNDERIYHLAQTCIAESDNRDMAVAQFLRFSPDHTPDGAPYSKSSVRAAMVGMSA